MFIHGSLGMGGAEVLRLSVLREFAKDPNYHVRVCTLRSRGELAEAIEALGVPVDNLGNRGGLFDVVGVWKLYRYLQDGQFDVIQSSQFLTNLHTNLAAFFLKRSSVIIEEHGIYSWKRWHHRLLDRWINSRADATVACSHRVAKSAADHLGIKATDITVIHNCVAAVHFEARDRDQRDLQERHFGCQLPFVVTIVGTLRWEKGHRYLFDAWRQLLDGRAIPEDSRLMVVGRGPLEEKLRRSVADLPSIVFLGQQQQTQEILAASDLFVLPSINEGFGIAIAEAMCAGLPIVATSSGGIPEVIASQETGVLVPPRDPLSLANAIADLFNDCQRSADLGSAARSDAWRRFRPQCYKLQLCELYETLLRHLNNPTCLRAKHSDT